MPSPIGHGLAAVAAGWAVARPAASPRALAVQAAIFAAVGAAPDLDLLVGRHSAEMHSMGAAAILATLAAWRRWPVAAGRSRIWLAVALAYASHPLLDALGFDTSPPIGVMAFWPLSHAYVQTSLHLFAPITRRWWLPGFFTHNLMAVVHEVAVLAPFVLIVWWWRRARTAPQ
jgi:membrane-bound metal-dependent hydrolase YbcI (DUF457 family)